MKEWRILCRKTGFYRNIFAFTKLNHPSASAHSEALASIRPSAIFLFDPTTQHGQGIHNKTLSEAPFPSTPPLFYPSTQPPILSSTHPPLTSPTAASPESTSDAPTRSPRQRGQCLHRKGAGIPAISVVDDLVETPGRGSQMSWL